MANFVSFHDKNARVCPQQLLWNWFLAYSCLVKIDQHEIIFKTSPNIHPFLKKYFSSDYGFPQFPPYWTIWQVLRFPQERFMGLFLGILHIFLNVSAKFQLYNIFFWVKLQNDYTSFVLFVVNRTLLNIGKFENIMSKNVVTNSKTIPWLF